MAKFNMHRCHPQAPPSLSVMRIDIDGYLLRSPRRGGHPPPLERVSVLQRQGLRLVWFGRPGCTWDWHPWFLCWLWKWHCRFHAVLAQPAGPPQGGPPCRFQPPYSCGPRRFPKGDRKALWSSRSAKPYNSTRTKHCPKALHQAARWASRGAKPLRGGVGSRAPNRVSKGQRPLAEPRQGG